MNENYPIVLHAIQTDTGVEWCAEYPDVPGVVGGGTTPEEAVYDAQDNLKAHLSFLEEDGITAPKATSFEEDDYSGKISFRTSKTLHKRIAIISKREKISINQFLNEAVCEKVAYYDQSIQFKADFDKALELAEKIVNWGTSYSAAKQGIQLVSYGTGYDQNGTVNQYGRS